MTIKTIPAQTIKTCDCCNKQIDRKNSVKDGKLTLKQDALDMQGSPCADATRIMDLCDNCLWDVNKALDVVLEKAKTTQKGGE